MSGIVGSFDGYRTLPLKTILHISLVLRSQKSGLALTIEHLNQHFLVIRKHLIDCRCIEEVILFGGDMCQWIFDKDEGGVHFDVWVDIDEIPSLEIRQINDIRIVWFGCLLEELSSGQAPTIFLDAFYLERKNGLFSFLFLEVNHQIKRFVEILAIDELNCLRLCSIEQDIRRQAFKYPLSEILSRNLKIKLGLCNRCYSNPVFGPFRIELDLLFLTIINRLQLKLFRRDKLLTDYCASLWVDNSDRDLSSKHVDGQIERRQSIVNVVLDTERGQRDQMLLEHVVGR